MDKNPPSDVLLPAPDATIEPAPAAAPSPPERRSRVIHHLVLLLASAGVLGASAVLETPDGKSVAFFGHPLPETCTFRRFVGHPCAGCGLTRCFVSLAHGRFADAWGFHPLGFVLFGVFLVQIPFRAAQIRRLWRGQSEWELRGMHWFWWPLFVVFLALWLWRMAW